MSRGNIILAIIIGFAVIGIGVGKIFEEDVNIHTLRKNSAWHYFGRMTLKPGKVSFKIDLQLHFPENRITPSYSLEIVAVPNHLWQAELQSKCHLANHSSDVLAHKAKQEFSFLLTMNHNSGYRAMMYSQKMIKEKRTFNLVLRDCQNSLVKEGFNKRSKIQVQMDIQSNDQHLDAHEECYNWALPLIFIGQAILLVFLSRGTDIDGESWAKFMLKISLWLGFSSILMKYIGHAIMAYLSGRVYGIFEVLYLTLHSVSDYLIIYLLVFLSFGWTVYFNNDYDQELWVPVGSMMGFIHLILVVINKTSDPHDKYHMFDTIPAYVMLGFRIIAFCVFIVGSIRSIVRLGHDQTKLRTYFQQLLCVGSLYMGFLPVVFMMVELVDEEERQEAMVLWVEMIKLVLNGWLVYLVGAKVSSYRQVTDASFMEKEDKYY